MSVSGTKQTSRTDSVTSATDPKQTFRLRIAGTLGAIQRTLIREPEHHASLRVSLWQSMGNPSERHSDEELRQALADGTFKGRKAAVAEEILGRRNEERARG